jgi:hypothetical protein
MSTISILTVSPWDVQLMCVCGAVVSLLIAIDLSVNAVRAFVRAVFSAAMCAFAAGAAFGLLVAVTLGVV